MDLSVIIAAGGRGDRMGAGSSKQLLLLQGKPVVAHTIGIFEPLEAVTEIVVAIATANAGQFQEEVVERHDFGKIKAVVPGGASRAESVRNALAALDPESRLVLVHDGARPLFPPELISDGFARLEDTEVDGVIFGLPATDTIKRTDSRGRVEATPDRDRFWEAQTPQIFRRIILEEAYRLPLERLESATDDAGLVESIGGRIEMVAGSSENIKITVPVDLNVAEAILEQRAAGGGS